MLQRIFVAAWSAGSRRATMHSTAFFSADRDAIWEIFRLNRMKSAVVNCDRKAALKSLLRSMLDDGLPNFDAALFDKAASQAAAYFTDPEAKTKIETDMAKYSLDASTLSLIH